MPAGTSPQFRLCRCCPAVRSCLCRTRALLPSAWLLSSTRSATIALSHSIPRPSKSPFASIYPTSAVLFTVPNAVSLSPPSVGSRLPRLRIHEAARYLLPDPSVGEQPQPTPKRLRRLILPTPSRWRLLVVSLPTPSRVRTTGAKQWELANASTATDSRLGSLRPRSFARLVPDRRPCQCWSVLPFPSPLLALTPVEDTQGAFSYSEKHLRSRSD
jgi:hypothetical protein